MISTDNLCMSCMREIGSAKQCPYCSYHVDSAQIPPYLPVRTVVANRYLIGKLLDYNGEGATYMAWDLSEKKAVNVREFFPVSISTRTTTALNLLVMNANQAVFHDCCQSFLELWTRLKRLHGLSALINVTDVVEDYGTAYAVYDYIEGETLREYLLSSKTGYISWERARPLLMPILSTLGNLHSNGIIHRGISPATLIVGNDGKVRITGFCIGQARTSRGDLDAQLYPGYSAIEQYGFDGQQGAWTDIYAFGAVLYRTLIGSDPIDATERVTNDRLMVPGKFAEQLPAYVINGLINSLQILPEDRTRSVEQLRAELSASPVAAASESIYPPSPAQQVEEDDEDDEDEPVVVRNKKAERKIALKTALISIAAGLLVFLALVFTVFRDDFRIAIGKDKPESTVDSSENGPVIVPDFSEKNYLDVTSNPVFASLYDFQTKFVFSDTVAKNYIVDQSIPKGTEVSGRTTITLFVSNGREQITLPEGIVGGQYEDVYKMLTDLGFKVEKKEDNNADAGYSDGQVITVSPVVGKKYDKGTTVVLKVYVAPEETTEEITDSPFFDNPPLDEPDPEIPYDDPGAEPGDNPGSETDEPVNEELPHNDTGLD